MVSIGYLDCVVDLYNCTATFASCRAVFKTCQQNLQDAPLGGSGATVATAGNVVRPAASGSSGAGTSRRTEVAGGDGTPSLADGAGKVPESKLTIRSVS